MKILRITALMVALAGVLPVQQAAAQTAAEIYDEARQYYRDQDFAGALPIILRAIQQDPGIPEYYLGAARTYFRLEQYDAAVLYYDIYIQHFGDRLPSTTPPNNAVARAREERASANSARPNPDAEITAPNGQNEARAALLQRIEQGTGLTATGGGAVAMYDAMIRAGYARPDLLQLRTSLMECLLAEAQLFVAPGRAVIPSLNLEQWTTQRERMRRYVALEDSDGEAAPEDGIGRPATAGEPDPARAMLHLAEGQILYIGGGYDLAASHFEQATAADPAMIPAWMGLLNSRYSQMSGRTAEVTAAIESLAALIETADPMNLSVVPLYEAAFAAQSGDRQTTVDIVGGILGLPEE